MKKKKNHHHHYRTKKKKKIIKEEISTETESSPLEEGIGQPVGIKFKHQVKPKHKPVSIDPRFDITKRFSLGERNHIRRLYHHAYSVKEQEMNTLFKERNDSDLSEKSKRKLQAKETQIRQVMKRKKDDELRGDVIKEHNQRETEKIRQGKTPWIMTKKQIEREVKKRKFKENGKKYVKRKKRKIQERDWKKLKKIKKRKNT